MDSSEHSDYFFSVEYPTICRNPMPFLIAMKVRERDNEKEVCYDITGRRNLAAIAEEAAFSLSFCRTIIREILEMMDQMSETLLDPNYICLLPEYIFAEEERLLYIYGYSDGGSFQDKVEGLLSWILSKINYDEDAVVQFMYRIFWTVRKQGFSGRLIRKMLEQEKGEEEIRSETYEEFFGKEARLERENPDDDHSGTRPSGWFRIKYLRNACIFVGLLLFVATGYLIVDGYLVGYRPADMQMICFGAVGVLLFALAAFALHIVDQKQKDCNKQDNTNNTDKTDKTNKTYSDQKRPEGFSPRPDNLEAALKDFNLKDRPVWEAEMGESPKEDKGATVILSAASRNMPVLKSLETGEVILVKECPFYIGSDPIINQMVLIDKTISRQHAVILKGRKKGHYEIRDLGSTNGTWIKGVSVNTDSADSLEDGDVIGFAQKKYRFIIRKDSL